MGAYLHNAGGTDRGRAYLFYGGGGLASKTANGADVILQDTEDSAYFGYSVASAGDVNGDGYSDVIVGAYFHDAGEDLTDNRGRAYIFYGGSLQSKTANGADVILQDTEDYANFGYSVASAGDLNGDGYSDVIVGAHYHNAGGTDRGRAYIFYGGTSK